MIGLRRRSMWKDIRIGGLLAALVVLAYGGVPASGAFQTIIDNGPSSNRIDLAILGDGYTAADIAAGTYDTAAADLLQYMFTDTEPYARYSSFFNVHQIDVVSNESGADVPPEGIYRDTALDASYYHNGGPERLLYASEVKVSQAVVTELWSVGIYPEMKLVTVNDSRYGGGGGAEMAVYPGGHASGTEVAMHESGHHFGKLADEYWFDDSLGTYAGSEPFKPNITKNSDPATVKWSQWIGYEDPDHPEIGPIGVFEGANQYETGLYRATTTSKMRALNQPFNALGREALILKIYENVDPLDDWMADDQPLFNPGAIWVDSVDSNLIGMRWYVDGVLVDGATDETFDLWAHGFAPGEHTVFVQAYDLMIDDWIRKSISDAQQFIIWNVEIQIPGDGNGDGYVDGADLGMLLARWKMVDGGWWNCDFNDDGIVDGADLGILLARWKTGAPPVSAAAMLIPEPTALVLLSLGALAAMRKRRSSRR